MKRMICLIAVINLLVASAAGQRRSGLQGRSGLKTQISITSINDRTIAPRPNRDTPPPPQRDIMPSPSASLYPTGEPSSRPARMTSTEGINADVTIDPIVEVRGEVAGLDPQQAEPQIVQIAANRLYDGRCYVLGSVTLQQAEGNAGKPVWRWVVEDVRFPLPEYGKGFEVVAVLVRKGTELPRGLVDYDTVLRYALAKTDQVHCKMHCEARIEITHIQDVTGELVRITPGAGPPLEVGWTATIKGKADRAKDTYVYLMIHPLTSDQRWVMERKGYYEGRDWTETGYFGREGLDTGEIFRVQAIVSKVPIAHGAYPPDTWDRIEQNLCGTSSEVLARRRIGPGDLVIEKVDDKPFVGNDPVSADIQCQVAGSIENPRPEYMLRPGELVWILFRSISEDEQWTVGALAFPLGDGFIWRVPVLRFPKAGRYKLMAVAAQTDLPLQKLSQKDWYALARGHLIRRLSRMVTVDAGVVLTTETDGTKDLTQPWAKAPWDWVIIIALSLVTPGLIWYAVRKFRAYRMDN
jgi:hypothetical protein